MSTKKRSLFGTLNDVKAVKVEWLWEPLIPFGMVTIAEGDPGIGKSFLMLHLAALVSTGGMLPNGQRVQRGHALILSAEDDAAYTVRPRIDAMGGDAARIRYLAEYSAFDDKGLAALRTEVLEHEPSLIIIDPLFAFVPSASDMYKPNEIRALLTRLAELAAEVEAAMVIVRHLRKSNAGKAIYQGVGSIDVIGAARSAVLVGVHPEDTELRVIAHLKHNIAPRGDSWLYELEVPVNGQMPVLRWRGVSNLTADDLLGAAPASQSAIDAAASFLREELKDGPKPAKNLFSKGTAAGHTERTLIRAKESIGISSKKQKSGWFWSLPD